ncbi:MAG: ABC transporter permease subunit [Fusobacteria bacterium]|nr:ABC transporter permease subunit [Fusobacteriota bacterium]
MRQTWAILKFTLIENISNKLFKGFIAFTVLIIIGIFIFKGLALYSQNDVVIGMGQLAIEFFLLLIAIFASSTQYFKDKKEKSIYLILTKPVSKSQYIVGKTLGIMALIAIDIVIMGAILTFVLLITGAHLTGIYYLTYLYMFYKLAIIITIGILFSVISDSMVTSNIFTILVYMIAYGVYELPLLAKQVGGGAFNYVFMLLYYILPNYYSLTIRDALLPSVSLHIFSTTCYSIAYCVIIMVIASLIFQRKEL